MAQKKNSGILFLLGAAIGAAAGYYLNSESGRKLRNDAAQKAGELAEEAESKAKEGVSQFKSGFNSAVEKSKDVFSEATDSFKSRLKQFENKSGETMEKVESAYQRGVDEARARINQKATEIDSMLDS